MPPMLPSWISNWKAAAPGHATTLAIEAVDRAMRGQTSPVPIYEGEDGIIAWLLDGPDAPEVTVQELDREIILYLDNIKGSNNYGERYEELDVTIPPLNPDTIAERYDSTYNFEGYQIYQLKDNEVSIADIGDLNKARLVAQCDIKNDVDMLVNMVKDETSGFSVPHIMVQGENKGIRHSFKFTEDAFATGDNRLVNHKKYYYVAIAYAYNNYLQYEQDINNPAGLAGQTKTYLAGRKSATGPIKVVTAIPHIPSPESDGTILHSCWFSQMNLQSIH